MRRLKGVSNKSKDGPFSKTTEVIGGYAVPQDACLVECRGTRNTDC